MGLDETAFRSRDYVIAIDEETNEKAGFGRIRIHKGDDDTRNAAGRRVDSDTDVCELTSIGVLPDWRRQGVGAHVVERLVQIAGDDGFETVYALTDQSDYLAQFGFERIDTATLPDQLQDRLSIKRDNIQPDAVPLRLATDRFHMPDRLRERFKGAVAQADETVEDTPEDFGIDPDSATYKYDTDR
ncbi:GNAT family N-acetyltransferase [Haloarculaceae archaeon H-GB2-1]|nr:GNAT family N-acetyltransferase [Haloarculaceae archaeon H-GB11]MEA5407837.1 GNAT family N-acetyltransferase [Haloarculaceae archaeon H-GB2-1]